jgi:hypothetical protein
MAWHGMALSMMLVGLYLPDYSCAMLESTMESIP